MSWLRFITVDSLCIAAEVTAALLLLSFSIPIRSRKTGQNSEKDSEKNLKLSALARRAFLEREFLLGLYWMDSGSDKLEISNHEDDTDTSTLEALGWLDRLCGGYNRSFLDEFLALWLALPSERRLGSTLSLIGVDDYSGLARKRGAVTMERTLRELANHIRVHYSSKAILGRLPPDRFLVINFDSDITTAFENFNVFQAYLVEQAKIEESLIQDIKLVASLTELSDEVLLRDELINKLEEGIAAASELGHSCRVRWGDQWNSSPPESTCSKEERRAARRHASQTTPPLANESGDLMKESSIATEPEPRHDDMPNGSKSSSSETQSFHESKVQRSVNQSDNGNTAGSDVTAVASAAEIAALFDQLKKEDNPNGPSVDYSPALKEPNSEESLSELASADDIAALFAQATAKPVSPAESLNAPSQLALQDSKIHQETAKPELYLKAEADTEQTAIHQPASSPEAAISKTEQIPTTPLSEIDLGEEATADDIASLFASIKGSVGSSSSTKIKAPLAAGQSEEAKPLPVDVSEVATKSDIDELFRSVKSAVTPIVSSESNPKTPAKDESKVEEMDLTQAASADDIEALFKMMKK